MYMNGYLGFKVISKLNQPYKVKIRTKLNWAELPLLLIPPGKSIAK